MDKTILLIGGNSGIGLESAKLLQSQGHQLHAAARSPEALQALGIATQSFDATGDLSLELLGRHHNREPTFETTGCFYGYLHDLKHNLIGKKMGWTMGLEPTTAGITTRSSTN